MASTFPPAGVHPTTAWAPWIETARQHRQRLRRLPFVAPFVFGYLVLSWVFFVPVADFKGTYFAIERDQFRHLLYEIPDLSREPAIAFRNLAIAPFLNQHSTQIVYVTALLLLFGVAIEAGMGTRAAVLLFFGTTLVGAIGAGLLLHLIYPDLATAPFLRRGWNDLWSGGSAGCFGLMGAVAARARRPWLTLGLFLFWELNVTIWYLQNYTPAFHLPALATGFFVTRLPKSSPASA